MCTLGRPPGRLFSFVMRLPDFDHSSRKGCQMAKFKALSRGSQLVLVAGPLLILSLFLTWQYVEVDYGLAGVAKMPLDGWDAWGLLLALLVMLHRIPSTAKIRAATGWAPERTLDDILGDVLAFERSRVEAAA